MTNPSLVARVAALEEKVGNKTMQEQFRDQAELMDRRLDESFRSQAALIDRLFAATFEELDGKWDVKLGEQLLPIKSDLGILREGMKIILAKLS
jgi:hypothetical protein